MAGSSLKSLPVLVSRATVQYCSIVSAGLRPCLAGLGILNISIDLLKIWLADVLNCLGGGAQHHFSHYRR